MNNLYYHWHVLSAHVDTPRTNILIFRTLTIIAGVFPYSNILDDIHGYED
jgi:hypothetical protein